MKVCIYIMLVLFCVSCGIKGDPVPPVSPVNWGSGLHKDKTDEKKKNENR